MSLVKTYIYIYVCVVFFLCPNVFPKELKLTGRIIDIENNRPLPYATLTVEKTNYSTVANSEGLFNIILKPETKFPIEVETSCVGYEKELTTITLVDTSITIFLQPNNYSLKEVSVSAKQIFMASKNSISTSLLSNNEVRGLSGFTNDLFRSIQLLPGVSSNNETSAKYNVRGGNYDENLVLINGIEIYNPFHVKQAPLVSVGIFNIDMVKDINFSSGGFNAEFGNALSSLLNINYESGSSEGFKGKLDLNFLDAALSTSGSIGKKLSYNVGLRRSNLEYVLNAAHVNPKIHMIYYDVQTQFDYQFNTDNKLRLNLIYSGDNYEQCPDLQIMKSNTYSLVKGNTTLSKSTLNKKESFLGTYRNLLVGFISENKLSENLSSKTSVAAYREFDDENIDKDNENNYSFYSYPNFWQKTIEEGNILKNLITTTLSYKQDLTFKIIPGILLQGGLAYRRLNHSYDTLNNISQTSSDNINKYPTVTSQQVASSIKDNDNIKTDFGTYRLEGYLQTSVQPIRTATINFGMRIDYFDLNKQTKYSPRINILYEGPFDINFRAAWGVFYQPPNFLQYRFYNSTKDNSGYEKATHYILGFDKNISEHVTLGVEAYYKKYDDFIPALKASNGRISYGNKLNNAVGFAKGIDVQLMANINKFFVWISYGHLVAREKITDSNDGYYPRFTDQTHTLSAVLGVDLGKNWKVTLKGFYGSGYAYTPSQFIHDATLDTYKWVVGKKNSAHYPAYERVDLNITKSFTLFNNRLDVYLDIMNLLNKQNILAFEYSYDSSGNSFVQQKKLVYIVPMIGIKYDF